MLFTHIFNSKIINNQCEGDWACAVFPQTGGVWTLKVAAREKTFLQQFVCQNACLGEAPYSTVQFEVKKIVFCTCVQVVMLFLSNLGIMLMAFSSICIDPVAW